MSEVKQYRKKPVEVQAMQYRDQRDLSALAAFVPDDVLVVEGDAVYLGTLENARHLVSEGDYVIRGVAGEFYACKPDVFGQTYDVV